MQDDQPGTPKLRRVRRMRNTSTLELVKQNAADTMCTNIRSGISRHRATMGQSDFALPQGFPRRRIGVERTSMLPSQIALHETRALDTERNDVELKLLYDKYLQGIMTEIIMKKKIEERKNTMLSQLATVAKECEHDEEKLFKLTTRVKDIQNLTRVQNEVEKQVNELDRCTEKAETKTLKDTLSQLYSLLKPLDVLRCNNIILPETLEEGERVAKALKSCANTLESIMNLVGHQKDTYKDVNDGIKHFLKTYNDIEDHQRKKLEKALCNLQVLVLKTVSFSLMQHQD